MIRILTVLFSAAIFSGCRDAFEFSPNQVFDRNSERRLNEKNLEKLHALPKDDTVTVVFVGDSQRFYDELDDFIEKVNSINAIDLILLAGDISDFGLLAEFELINERLEKLNKPYFGVVGNHDVVARGEEVFERMFGPLNFSFTYGNIKFIAHNTNGKEYFTGNVPDLEWLAKELIQNDSAKYFIPVSHVPPFSGDFDKNLEAGYTALFAETPSLLVSIHGHTHAHDDGFPYNDGIRYITTHSFDKRSFVILKIHEGAIQKIIIDY